MPPPCDVIITRIILLPVVIVVYNCILFVWYKGNQYGCRAQSNVCVCKPGIIFHGDLVKTHYLIVMIYFLPIRTCLQFSFTANVCGSQRKLRGKSWNVDMSFNNVIS